MYTFELKKDPNRWTTLSMSNGFAVVTYRVDDEYLAAVANNNERRRIWKEAVDLCITALKQQEQILNNINGDFSAIAASGYSTITTHGTNKLKS